MAPTPTSRGDLATLLAIVVAFGVVTRLGLLFIVEPERISCFWPASGLLLAALALTPSSRWTAILAGVLPVGLLLNWASGRSLAASAGLTVADVLEAWPAALVLQRLARRGGGLPDLGELRSVLALVLAAAPVSAVLSAAAGAAVVVGSGAPVRYVDIFGSWCLSVLISDLVVAPFVIAWATQPRAGISGRRLAEAAALFGLLVAVTAGVLGRPAASLSLVFLPFPLVLWAALRFGPPGASLASLLVASIAALLTVRGVSPLASLGAPTSEQVHWLQLLAGTVGVSSLALAAAVAEQRRSAARLVEAEARQRATIRSAPMGIVVVDAAGRLIDVNPVAASILGRPADALLGRTFAELTHEEDRASSLDVLAAMTRGERERAAFEKRYVRPDGSVVHAHLSVAVERDDAGRFRHAVAMLEDVSERRRLEAQLLQSQKTEAIGKLAGGVAHDFNNLLTAILAQADFAARFGRSDAAVVSQALAEIRGAADRGAQLTRQLLAFARKQHVEPRVTDLNGLVRDVLGLLRRLITEEVEVRFAPGADLWPVRIDRVQFEQVVVNLAVNARDAMPRGGVLTLATENVPGGEERVRLTITDTGTGIDRATLVHLFEPYFSTKPPGRGTGLGLSTAQGVVTQAGGKIGVTSEVGRGTTFELLLPRAHGEDPPAPAAAALAPGGGDETILVVEDDAAVRRVAREVLRGAGYTVLEAADAERALEAVAAHAGRIDLLLSDVVMPGASGPELAARLRAGRPDLRVLFTSGYAADALARHELDGGALVPKPYTCDGLLAKVRESLGRPVASGPPAGR